MIEKLLLEYKGLTEAIIVNIKNDLDVEALMERRGLVLVRLLEDITLNKKEIKDAYINIGLEKLDKLLKVEIDIARERNKIAIKDMQLRKNVNKAYGTNINTINTFNKKI